MQLDSSMCELCEFTLNELKNEDFKHSRRVNR